MSRMILKRFAFVVLVMFFSVLLFLPNVIHLPSWWPMTKKVNYGLDIQGGLHLVMGVDVQNAVKESALRHVRAFEADLAKEGVTGVTIKVTDPDKGIFTFESENLNKVTEYLDKNYGTILLKRDQVDKSISYSYLDAYLLDYKSKIIQQSVETIRNRIDEFGVAEPSIQAQGENRILVQLPGMEDAEQAKALVQTAAKLDFMLVEERSPEELLQWVKEAEEKGGYQFSSLKYSEYIRKINEDLKDKLPPQTQIYFEKSDNVASMEAGRSPYLLRADTGLDGSALDDANVTFNQYGAPEVSLRFNSAGAQKFKELTQKNIGRRMAVVLDKVIKTAPNIQTEISNGQAVITLGSAQNRDQQMAEAKMIATSLRAGSLPAALEQLEERRIGPTLGADALKNAQMAAIVGGICVMFIIIVRYKVMGLIASIGLAFNLMLMISLLSLLGGTLTLPGVAGIALSAGVAVDANVLIFERMREELLKGNSFTVSIKEGFHRALSAILDANMVVAATSLVLLYFGTGPVRGFAVTLLTGIITTMFTQVYATQVVVEAIVAQRKGKSLSI